ncbi:MAG: hypothetical protein A2275_02640 [Bacteroidetes bacterium RIFOXYA12_FULL_35_11]|nr:MAG: hypothetical protein A2X01_07050 [Bacteroidetes bacterium GWF2_35_48]OFY82099.1 MAG: hypothetical protein A2275_02640 [Bacteroidetes bacterium RIFOXYA12_FULL_35_11]OFY93297.1 MAG: hypothetical protein A2491_15445 [Bacteroidetes bacterium RIFOXYC12_FULL_35_7]HBX53143.1 hypothetical protein [Bacteroidales bacterium]
MSIGLNFFNVIIPRKLVEEKYNGGIVQFFSEHPVHYFQQDDFLIKTSFMDSESMHKFIDILVSKGLEYDYEKKYSNDFVIIGSITGNEWNVDWIKRKGWLAYHIDELNTKI